MTPVVRVLPVTAVRGYEEWLTPVERARRDRRVRPEDRTAYVAAHLLARTVAAELLGMAPSEVVLVQRCADCGATDHGRPAVEGHDIHLSLSHASGVVAAMAAPVPCGIDVESLDRDVPTRALTCDERHWAAGEADPLAAAVLLWTRKEALVKASGLSLTDALATDVLGGAFGGWQDDGHVASWTL